MMIPAKSPHNFGKVAIRFAYIMFFIGLIITGALLMGTCLKIPGRYHRTQGICSIDQGMPFFVYLFVSLIVSSVLSSPCLFFFLLHLYIYFLFYSFHVVLHYVMASKSSAYSCVLLLTLFHHFFLFCLFLFLFLFLFVLIASC